MSRIADNRIYTITRLVLALVNIFLLFAFAVLYLFPQTTRQNFAWEINPPLTAVFMGSGYISGAFMFFYAIFGKKWHKVKNSLLPVSAFAAIMLVVTFLHYDRFIHTNFAFVLWMGIYIVTPILVPWLWYHNRPADPGLLEAKDKVVPNFVRWATGIVGILTLLFWAINFINPGLLIAMWPWKLTPLTARTICAWGTLISVGGLVLSRESRWSAWRYNIQSIALWQVLMIIGSLLHRQDFNHGSLFNGYFIAILIMLFSLLVLYFGMEIGAQSHARQFQPADPGVD